MRLITKLKNQSEFTQTAYLGGENEAGIAMVEGVRVRGNVDVGCVMSKERAFTRGEVEEIKKGEERR